MNEVFTSEATKTANGNSPVVGVIPPLFGFADAGTPVSGLGGVMAEVTAELQQAISKQPFAMVQQGFRQSAKGDNTWEGLPYKGVVYPIKDTDPPSRKPQFRREVHVQILLLDNVDDLRRYEQIIQRVSDGLAVLSFEERKYDEKRNTWRVLIRWADQYYVSPPELQEQSDAKQ